VNCKAATRELSSYIDGDLNVELRQDLEIHLQGCEHCTVVMNQVKMTVDLFCDAEPVELPSDVRSRLYEALQAKLGNL
jgi:anti-sigma factor RsiW